MEHSGTSFLTWMVLDGAGTLSVSCWDITSFGPLAHQTNQKPNELLCGGWPCSISVTVQAQHQTELVVTGTSSCEASFVASCLKQSRRR